MRDMAAARKRWEALADGGVASLHYLIIKSSYQKSQRNFQRHRSYCGLPKGAEDLEREGPQPFKFAGIGGLSEFVGWTDQQRAAAANEGLGYRLVFSARLIGLIVAVDALFLGAQQVGRYLQ